MVSIDSTMSLSLPATPSTMEMRQFWLVQQLPVCFRNVLFLRQGQALWQVWQCAPMQSDTPASNIASQQACMSFRSFLQFLEVPLQANGQCEVVTMNLFDFLASFISETNLSMQGSSVTFLPSNIWNGSKGRIKRDPSSMWVASSVSRPYIWKLAWKSLRLSSVLYSWLPVTMMTGMDLANLLSMTMKFSQLRQLLVSRSYPTSPPIIRPLISCLFLTYSNRASRGTYLPKFLFRVDQSARAMMFILRLMSVTSAIVTGMNSAEKGMGFALLPSHPKTLQWKTCSKLREEMEHL